MIAVRIMVTIIDNTVLTKIKSSWNQWIKNSVEFCAISENDIQVITSFTDYFDDGILFDIISKPNGTFVLTDKGYTLWNMEVNGIDLTKKGSTRYKLFHWYLKSFNGTVSNNHIQKDDIKLSNLSQAISDFIQLLLRVSDLAVTNRANTKGIFFDDAKKYFEREKNTQFYFTTNNIALGRSNQHYKFEYNFTPKLGTNKLTKLYNTLSKNTMEAVIGIYSDTTDYFNENYSNSSFNILVNGIADNSMQYVSGLREHDINVIDFQDKNDVIKSFGNVS